MLPPSLLLTINGGSSSVKFSLFGLSLNLPLLAGGQIAGIGDLPSFQAHRGDNAETEKRPVDPGASHEMAIDVILDWLATQRFSPTDIRAVAHRIVHGGEKFAVPVRLTAEAMVDLRALNPLAPLHQPHNLACVDILERKVPGAQSYGCFDTGFHAAQDRLHTSFALPESLRAKGVRRYGFHGLSYDWIAQCLRADFPDLLPGRVVVAHLGNGASLCAMKAGASVETTMGLTPLDGLPMGSRCGAIDAGAVTYMVRELGLPVQKLEAMLYEESGLKGLSGLSNDVEILSASQDENAKFALDYFALKAAQGIAAMAVSLGGLDALVFTGGIGEHARNVRDMILGRLSFLPPFATQIIPANEERGMALAIVKAFYEDLQHE